MTPIGDSIAWMNGTIEADICGNVNPTHLMGSRIQNGNGDFARKAYVSMLLTRPPPRAGRSISCIVPIATSSTPACC